MAEFVEFDFDGTKERMKDMPIDRSIGVLRMCDCPVKHLDIIRLNTEAFESLLFLKDSPDDWTIMLEPMDEEEGVIAFHLVRTVTVKPVVMEIKVTVVSPPHCTMKDCSVLLFSLGTHAKSYLARDQTAQVVH